jgi:uncharacterized membrane protein YiaA
MLDKGIAKIFPHSIEFSLSTSEHGYYFTLALVTLRFPSISHLKMVFQSQSISKVSLAEGNFYDIVSL